jgi:hypothetical protein
MSTTRKDITDYFECYEVNKHDDLEEEEEGGGKLDFKGEFGVLRH